MMRILIASPYVPWPLNEGGRVAQYRTFEALRDFCTFTLVVPVYNLEQAADVQLFAAKFPDITTEAVHCFQIEPPPPLRARLRRAVGKFLRAMVPSPKVSPPSAPTAGEKSPWYPFGCLHPDYVAAVEKHFNFGCDIFQAEFAEMMSLGPLMAGRVPTVFVHHQLHYVYARRFMEANAVCGVHARYLTERMTTEEAGYLNTFDRVVVFSEVDQKSLEDFCPSLKVSVSPFPSPEEPLPAVPRFARACKQFVFVASAIHGPNAEGLSWFMKGVWPAIKKRMPDASIEVIGKWSLAAQQNVPNHADIRFEGFLPELGAALRIKIMIVPVWVGSGIRTKILAAWGAGCPVVTTTVGVEGLPGKSGEHFMLADEASAFAHACIELSQNVDKLNQIAANGFDLVQTHYSLASVRKTRLEIYEKLVGTKKDC
jgi:glycosyltransferase involved in cell wall biosynthesis